MGTNKIRRALTQIYINDSMQLEYTPCGMHMPIFLELEG
jgi:hypothetical protein